MLGRDEASFALLGILGGVCMVMALILRNTPPTGVQWLAIMFISGGGGLLSYLVLESYGKYTQWETPVAFAAGFCATHLGKYALLLLEDPKKLLVVFNWIRGKNDSTK